MPSKLDVASSSLVSRCPDPAVNSFRIRNNGCGSPPPEGARMRLVKGSEKTPRGSLTHFLRLLRQGAAMPQKPVRRRAGNRYTPATRLELRSNSELTTGDRPYRQRSWAGSGEGGRRR